MRSSLLLIILLTALVTKAEGQALLADDNLKTAGSNVRDADYPKITKDLRVVFQIKAPDVQKLQVKIEKVYDMIKDEKGLWSVTTDPQVPGFHYYFLLIDGYQVSDPASETFFGWVSELQRGQVLKPFMKHLQSLVLAISTMNHPEPSTNGRHGANACMNSLLCFSDNNKYCQ